MIKKILIADDNVYMVKALKRFFSVNSWGVYSAFDGKKAEEIALKRGPDVIILDIEMPKTDGRNVLRNLRKHEETALTPVIMLTGYSDYDFKDQSYSMGADDYITKPFSFEDLRLKVESVYDRNRRAVSSNPLTRLPGAPAIAAYVSSRIAEGKKIGYLYADIDNFKAFNDVYGYLKGDEAIKTLGETLREAKEKFGGEDIFVGHIGGDFVAVCQAGIAERLASFIASSFDKKVPALYAKPDAEKGFIESPGRRGEKLRFPLMSLSIAVSTNEHRKIRHHAHFADISAQLKSCLKKSKNRRKKSVFMKDRRTKNWKTSAKTEKAGGGRSRPASRKKTGAEGGRRYALAAC